MAAEARSRDHRLDPRVHERADESGEQTKLFARTVDESSKHIGRSLAFATGGFVAFAGATEFLPLEHRRGP